MNRRAKLSSLAEYDFEDTIPNVPQFNARLEPWPGEPSAIVGEGWSEAVTDIEKDVMRAYEDGETPHLDFANLSADTATKGALEALAFIKEWAPLRQSHYLAIKAEEVQDAEGRAVGLELLEPLKFRVPLNELWREQAKFRESISIWADQCAGTDSKVDVLVKSLNAALKEVRPRLQIDEGKIRIHSLGGQDFLTDLYFCLWRDIAGKREVRRCADGLCQRFFRPSRERQIYHEESCKRRRLQREYARVKRNKLKKRRGKH